MRHTEKEYEALEEELWAEDRANSPDGRIQINVRRIYDAVLDARAKLTSVREIAQRLLHEADPEQRGIGEHLLEVIKGL